MTTEKSIAKSANNGTKTSFLCRRVGVIDNYHMYLQLGPLCWYKTTLMHIIPFVTQLLIIEINPFSQNID